jgi:hypothetical protein
MWTIALALTCFSFEGLLSNGVFPGAEWEQRTPASLGLDGVAVDQVAERLGGRGCIVSSM